MLKCTLTADPRRPAICRCTKFEGGYTSASPQVQWFWRVVASLRSEERGLLLRFATGSSVPGPGGFARLRGLWGERSFTLVRASFRLTPVACQSGVLTSGHAVNRSLQHLTIFARGSLPWA